MEFKIGDIVGYIESAASPKGIILSYKNPNPNDRIITTVVGPAEYQYTWFKLFKKL